MPRIAVAFRAKDEAGNATGGSPTEVRIWDDFAASVAAIVTDDAAGGTTIAQPITPNSGAQTTLTVTTATGDTTLTVASTTGFSVGQLIPIFDGTNTRYRFIRSILAGPPRLTIEQTIGVVFSNTNTQVGNLDMVGVVAGYVTDTSYHYAQVKDVASSRLMPATLIPSLIGTANVGVLEEGAGGGTRPTLNFIGASVTAADNAPSTRIDITITGLQADGTVTAPSIGFVSDTNTGIYRVAADAFSATAGGVDVLQFIGVASAVNYLRVTNAVTGAGAILDSWGTDASVALHLRSRGSGGFVYLDSGKTDYAYTQGGTGAFSVVAAGGSADIDIVVTPKGAGVTKIDQASIAAGGTSGTVLANTGGSGPTSNVQSGWLKIKITAGAVRFLPIWT